MITSFRDKHTETFYRGERVAAFSGFGRAAERKLDQLMQRLRWATLPVRAIASKCSRTTVTANGAYGSTISGGYVQRLAMMLARNCNKR